MGVSVFRWQGVMNAIPPCAITGTNGYVGGAIAARFESLGAHILRLSRSSGYSLAHPPSPSDFAGRAAETLIHCAYDFSVTSWADIRRVNVDGSIRLFDAARRGGVQRIVFVSSLAAYDGCASLYGRGKRLVEQAVLERGGQVIRPGTVFGPAPRGIMGALTSQVATRRWIPVIQHPRSLHLAHEEDVIALVATLAAAGGDAAGPGVWRASGPRAWTLQELVAAMARRSHRRVRLLPVPWQVVRAGLATAERLGLRPAFRSDSVLSLAHPVPADQFASLRVSPDHHFRDF